MKTFAIAALAAVAIAADTCKVDTDCSLGECCARSVYTRTFNGDSATSINEKGCADLWTLSNLGGLAETTLRKDQEWYCDSAVAMAIAVTSLVAGTSSMTL